MGYENDVHRRLQEVFDRSADSEREIDLDSARIVMFSDHHKGQRDGADDFRRCERAYHAALGYYLEKGYTLLALGDVEELWECRPKRAIAAYEYTLQLEAEFYRAGRYQRFTGNHDDEWESPAAVKRYLDPFFPSISVAEGARFKVKSGGTELGTLFLVHGHQGTSFSDRRRKIAKFFVRHIWRPIQRLLNTPSTTPSTDYRLREKHDRTIYGWAAANNKLLLIAGHTHRPVFMADSHSARILRELKEARTALAAGADADSTQARVAGLRAELEWIKAQGEPMPAATESPAPILKPCYFNTGCCSFGDGDITGLEIVDGKIKLVRWPDDDGRPVAKILAAADLQREVFAKL